MFIHLFRDEEGLERRNSENGNSHSIRFSPHIMAKRSHSNDITIEENAIGHQFIVCFVSFLANELHSEYEMWKL